MEPGLYLTFFTEGEPLEHELPPVGPLEHVVVRDGSLIADRKDGEIDLFGGGGRWVEAEHELRRATGKEPGGVRRDDLRIGAPEGVYLRFVSFGEAAEHDPVPELGPYAIVVVGRRVVEADGDPLAIRTGRNQNLWELTAVGGSALAGVIRPHIAFRTRSTKYHREIKPFRAAPKASPTPSHPKPAPAPARAISRARPPKDPGLTLRDRIRAEQPTRRAAVASARSEGRREWAGAVWRLRLAIIGALVILIVAFSVPSVRSLFTAGTPGGTISTVSIGTSITSPDWSYTVGSVRRIAKIGSAQARGIFLVVQVAATNRKGAGAQLLPSAFALAAPNGEQYAASAARSGVYSGDANLSSSYLWPTEFPVGRSVVLPLIFEVSAALTGTQLVILDVPATRIRLE